MTLSGSRDGQGLVGSGQKELESLRPVGLREVKPASLCGLPSPGCEILDAPLPPPPTSGPQLTHLRKGTALAFGKVWELSETEGAPAVETDFRGGELPLG